MPPKSSVVILAVLSLLCGCAMLDRGPTPVVQLGASVENPGEFGAFDAGWHVDLRLDRLEALGSGDSARNFLRDETDRRYDFRLQGSEAGTPTVWRGRLIARGEDRETGSFTLTRRDERLIGRIRVGERVYNLQASSAEQGRLFRVDPEQIPEPGPAIVPRDGDRSGR